MNSEKLVENIKITDDIIDNLLEPIKDYTDTLGDIASPIKGLISIYNLRKKILYKSFLKGYSKKIESNQISENDRVKMKKFLNNSKNIIYISEIIETALNSISIDSSTILGMYAGQILTERELLNDIDYVLISAIKDLTDSDLDNFMKLYTFLKNNDVEKREVSGQSYEYYMKEVFSEAQDLEIPFELQKIEFTIEKLKIRGILSYSGGGIGLYGNNRGAFMFSEYSDALFDILKKIKNIV